jgi:diguanylate cyclase (GGDEF)-like protein
MQPAIPQTPAAEKIQGIPMFSSVRQRISEAALPLSLLVLALLSLSVEWTVQREIKSRETRRDLEILAFSGTLRTNVERELNTLLSISRGLDSYIRVHHKSIDTDKTKALLADLYYGVEHVQNLSIAEGFRVKWVYPLRGNEKVLGLDYRAVPLQFEQIEQAIAARSGVLAGPLSLVQGGQALIYRYPAFVENRYWGVISTAINTQSFFNAAFAEVSNQPYVFAIRKISEGGEPGEVFYGDPQLFSDKHAYIKTSVLPDGLWRWAIKETAPAPATSMILLIRGLGWTLSLLASLLIYLFLRERVRLANYALYDGLTGVANRRLLAERMKQHFSFIERSPDQTCSVLLIDLNGFKQVNDNHGHAAGDVVLQTVARRITAQVRSTDTVARLGGDEYVVIVNHEKDGDLLESLKQRLRDAITGPVGYRGIRLSIDLSIGIATYPEDGATLDQLLHTADGRMYADKHDAREADRGREKCAG